MLFFEGGGKMDSVEVHIFSDASIVAYGAVAYFRYVNLRGEVSTSFVMSKSRISPLKKLSLPRLELMGALIAARLWKYLSKDIQLLKKNKTVPPHSKIYSLVPYVDDRGILRVKGRLEQAELFHNEKHPAILPKSKLTDLIIMSEHVKSFHSGVVSTLSRVRNNFWIPRGRQVVKKVISECLICKKCALKPAKQLTGQLPRDRVVESPPFAVVGIDFTGAITIKEGDQSCKIVYIALFTCAVTRAVHIEVVSDMSVKSLIFALRRFYQEEMAAK
ncbi:reverse transcriptase [Caerostris extrusa]|uniref:Reverse transcriptase n=1 Tax=Caerostris extrusa TaxID=172846 RepID=A0AAV4VP26_CAEEX|nr:reverse transcriptase [Caerostris extrusa]